VDWATFWAIFFPQIHLVTLVPAEPLSRSIVSALAMFFSAVN
jgi:hypothetical protein